MPPRGALKLPSIDDPPENPIMGKRYLWQTFSNTGYFLGRRGVNNSNGRGSGDGDCSRGPLVKAMALEIFLISGDPILAKNFQQFRVRLLELGESAVLGGCPRVVDRLASGVVAGCIGIIIIKIVLGPRKGQSALQPEQRVARLPMMKNRGWAPLTTPNFGFLVIPVHPGPDQCTRTRESLRWC